MHYKTIVKMCYSKKNLRLQWPYPFNTNINLKNLGTVLFLRARGIQKSIYRLHTLIFSVETCICLRMVEDQKFSAFY